MSIPLADEAVLTEAGVVAGVGVLAVRAGADRLVGGREGVEGCSSYEKECVLMSWDCVLTDGSTTATSTCCLRCFSLPSSFVNVRTKAFLSSIFTRFSLISCNAFVMASQMRISFSQSSMSMQATANLFNSSSSCCSISSHRYDAP